MSEEEPTALESFAGAVTEIDAAGDYIVDTTDAVGGDVHLRLAAGRAFCIEIGGQLVFEVKSDGSQVSIDLGGSASERLVLGNALQALLNEFFVKKYDVHTHPTSVGPTGPPLPLFTGTQITDAQLSSVARTKP